jgi:hypothetical protein
MSRYASECFFTALLVSAGEEETLASGSRMSVVYSGGVGRWRIRQMQFPCINGINHSVLHVPDPITRVGSGGDLKDPTNLRSTIGD